MGIRTALTSFATFDALCVDGRSPEAVARQLTEPAERVVGVTPP
jgi:hypothetical protein